LKKNPNLIVEELKNYIDKKNNKGSISSIENIIEEVSVAGPYLNIKINKLKILELLKNYNYKNIS
jgi:hypothetical protein